MKDEIPSAVQALQAAIVTVAGQHPVLERYYSPQIRATLLKARCGGLAASALVTDQDLANSDDPYRTMIDAWTLALTELQDQVESTAPDGSSWKVCPDCDGTGNLWDGYTTQDEPLKVICEMCHGEGGWRD